MFKRSILAPILLTGIISVGYGVMAPFVIPGSQQARSLIGQTGAPIGYSESVDRITVDGDRFYRNNSRFKVWGVNLCFGANFPTHDQAEAMAERIARAGVNSVRLHHMDTAWYPIGIWHPNDGKTIYPVAVDRLDYLIDQFARHGIYVNLNLHVGRNHSHYLGLPDPGTSFDKIVGLYNPHLINGQRVYAAELMTHTNPYRGRSYVNDPVVAFVEITNEDSFFMWSGDADLRGLPAYYADMLQRYYNLWLIETYTDTDTLRAAWSEGVEPLGPDVLTSLEDHFTDPQIAAKGYWYLEQHEGCQADFVWSSYLSRPSARLAPVIADDTSWHLQVKHRMLAVERDQYYTLSFDAVAEQARSIGVGVMQDHSPWSNLGFSRNVELTTDWKTYTFGFVATEDDEPARINISFGGPDMTPFYLTNVQLRTGGQTGLNEDETLEDFSVRVFAEREIEQRQIDRMRFLAETEKNYFDQMKDFIKNQLGYQGLVTGTIVFGPLGLWAQSDMDYIDAHAYWQHPRFPNKPWDPVDWYIEQKPMTDYMEEATLFGLSAKRLGRGDQSPGKPFTVSEYNHPAPLDSQVACVPMIASYGAAQDWDGIWLFTYVNSGDEWDSNYFSGFFDLIHTPAKWGFMPTGTAIFLNQGITPVGDTYHYIGLTSQDHPLTTLTQLHMRYDSNLLGVMAELGGVTRPDLLEQRYALTLDESGSTVVNDNTAHTALDWQIDPDGKGIYCAVSDNAWVYVGHQDKFADASGSKVVVTEPAYCAVSVVSYPEDNSPAPLSQSNKILITACGRCENKGMIFSSDRTTVGNNWGREPVQIEPIAAVIQLPVTNRICYALNPDGTIGQVVPVREENGITTLEIYPALKTMWYLVVPAGDISCNGRIDLNDILSLSTQWLTTNCFLKQNCQGADLDFSNDVNLPDLMTMINNWLVDR